MGWLACDCAADMPACHQQPAVGVHRLLPCCASACSRPPTMHDPRAALRTCRVRGAATWILRGRAPCRLGCPEQAGRAALLALPGSHLAQARRPLARPALPGGQGARPTRVPGFPGLLHTWPMSATCTVHHCRLPPGGCQAWLRRAGLTTACGHALRLTAQGKTGSAWSWLPSQGGKRLALLL